MNTSWLKPFPLAAFNTITDIFLFSRSLPVPPLSLSFSGCLSARGVWGQKGLLAPVGLLRWLALPPPLYPPSACNSMVCPTHLSSCMDSMSSVPLSMMVYWNTGWGLLYWYLTIWRPDVMCICWYSMLQGAPCPLWSMQSVSVGMNPKLRFKSSELKQLFVQ